MTDRAALYTLLDSALICHLAMVRDGAPVVLPTGYGREDDTLYLHGSTGAASLRLGATGVEVCVAVTAVDGIVYARSTMHHSMNYRSAVIHGRARPLTDDAAKLRALRAITEHLAPGSWDHARQPDNRELAATAVLALELTEAAVKVRAGVPVDDADDVASGAWAGVLPLHQEWGKPRPADDLAPGIDVPDHIRLRADPIGG